MRDLVSPGVNKEEIEFTFHDVNAETDSRPGLAGSIVCQDELNCIDEQIDPLFIPRETAVQYFSVICSNVIYGSFLIHRLFIIIHKDMC